MTETLFPDQPHTPAMPKGNRAHPGIPGDGPGGESCRTCSHPVLPGGTAKNYYKCGLMRPFWTHGPGSDIHLKDPACPKWEKKGAA